MDIPIAISNGTDASGTTIPTSLKQCFKRKTTSQSTAAFTTDGVEDTVGNAPFLLNHVDLEEFDCVFGLYINHCV